MLSIRRALIGISLILPCLSYGMAQSPAQAPSQAPSQTQPAQSSQAAPTDSLPKNSNASAADKTMANYFAQNYEASSPAITAQARAITQGKTTALDKARAVHDWVASNVSWPQGQVNLIQISAQYEKAVDVLQSKQAVCGGMSSLAASMLKAVRSEDAHRLWLDDPGSDV